MKAKTLSILILVGLLLHSTEQKSQSVDFGLSAGISSGTVKVSEIGNAITNTIQGDNIIGFEGGLFSRLNMDPLSVKGMLLVAYNGGLSDYKNEDGSMRTSKLSVGKIEVPILFGLRFMGPLRLEAGPVVNWIFSESHAADESINLRKTGYGYRIGANIELGILSLGLHYQGLKNKSDDSSTATYATPDELIFSLGIVL